MQKYLQDNLLLTKEAFEQYIIKQRESEAASYGLTLEQYQQAVINGSVVQSSPQSGSL
jgi:hypothetical protein